MTDARPGVGPDHWRRVWAAWIAGLALWLGAGPAKGEGTVTEASTAALLRALQGGGHVQLTFLDTLVLETPVWIGVDTLLEGAASGGRSVTLSGGQDLRLFRVLPGVRLEIRNCVLREGQAAQGGAILNEGFLLASNVTFIACRAEGADGEAGEPGENGFGIGGDGGDGLPGEVGEGGAVLNLGEAEFIQCVFTSNVANGGTGGVGGDGGTGTVHNGRGGAGADGGPALGGAIASRGGLSVLGSVFTANSATAGDGGAGGSATAVQRAGQGGAGAMAAGGAIFSSGWLRLAQSAFATNLATGGDAANAAAPFVNVGLDGPPGGFAYGGAVASWSNGVVINTTFFTNLLVGGDGGDGAAGSFTVGDGGGGGDARGSGIHARGSLALTNVTLAWNSGTNGLGGAAASGGAAKAGDPGRLAGGAIAVDGAPGATLVNCILVSPSWLSTVDGQVRDGGFNLFSDGGTGEAVKGSMRHTDALLGAYQVWTQGPPGLLPRQGSPALDSGDPDAAPAVDQRGLARPVGLGPDIGALETGGTSFSISGRMVAGDAGIPGVRLSVGVQEVVTDENGAFRFGPLGSGYYTVVPEGEGHGFTPRVIQLFLDAHVEGLEFRLNALTASFARTGSDGVSVITAEGVPGWSYRLEGGPGLNAWKTLGTAVAGSDGRVEFHHETAGASGWFYRVSTR